LPPPTAEGEPARDPDLHAVATSRAAAAGQEVFTRTLALLCIADWTSVGDDQGAPLPVTEKNVLAYLKNWRVFDAVEEKFVNPALAKAQREALEKNVSATSQSGTSAGAGGTTVPTAKLSKGKRVKAARIS
jgi:hypothetical protein